MIAVALALAGCSASPVGELTAATCSDGEDNDGDELKDCGDPDCQAFAHCLALGGPQQPPENDAGQEPRPSGAGGGGGTGGVSGGAGGSGGAAIDAGDDEDASAPPGPDAGPDPCAACEPPQVCVDDACVDPPPTTGTFTVRLISVGVPLHNAFTNCFDTFCDSPIPSPPYGLCTCPPDPFVQLSRLRDGSSSIIDRTPSQNDSLMPDFSDHEFVVELVPGDGLRFTVFDDDLIKNESMYSCDVEPPLPASGTISCAKRVFADGPEFAIVAEIAPAPSGG